MNRYCCIRLSARVYKLKTLINVNIERNKKNMLQLFALHNSIVFFLCKMYVNIFLLFYFSLSGFCWDLKSIVLDMAATYKLKTLKILLISLCYVKCFNCINYENIYGVYKYN